MAYIGAGITRFNTADDLTVTDDAEIKGGLTVDTTTLVVDEANNRVGVGTTSPNDSLHVKVPSPTTDFNSTALLDTTSTTGSADVGSRLGFGYFDGVNARTGVAINGAKENGTSGNYAAYMSFVTRPNGGPPEERVRITSTGNVGIGTSSPARAVHLSGSGNRQYFLGETTSSAGTDEAGFRIKTPSAEWQIYSVGNSQNLAIRDTLAPADRLRINSSGDLQFNSGFGSVATAYGCRAWVNFAGDPVSIRDDGNVSSITDAGVGEYQVNFSNSMPDDDYAVVGDSFSPISTPQNTCEFKGVSSQGTSSFLFNCRSIDFDSPSSYDFADSATLQVAVFR